MIKIQGHKNLYRDEKTGAILNNDDYEYNQYLAIKQEKINQKNEIENIKNEISEIKSLLRELLNGSR